MGWVSSREMLTAFEAAFDFQSGLRTSLLSIRESGTIICASCVFIFTTSGIQKCVRSLEIKELSCMGDITELNRISG